MVESLAIGQEWHDDVRIVLFVRLVPGVVLDEALKTRIRSQIRDNTTSRHVPGAIVQVADIPRTKSGKIVELAVNRVVHGREVTNREPWPIPRRWSCFGTCRSYEPDRVPRQDAPIPAWPRRAAAVTSSTTRPTVACRRRPASSRSSSPGSGRSVITTYTNVPAGVSQKPDAIRVSGSEFSEPLLKKCRSGPVWSFEAPGCRA